MSEKLSFIYHDYAEDDVLIEVIRNSNRYTIGNISPSVIGERLLFTPADGVCFSLEELSEIARKMLGRGCEH